MVMHVYIHVGSLVINVVCLSGMLYECLAFGYGKHPWLSHLTYPELCVPHNPAPHLAPAAMLHPQ